MKKPVSEWVPERTPIRKSLSPDDVERLQALGYEVKQQAFTTMSNGHRMCTVTKGATMTTTKENAQ